MLLPTKHTLHGSKSKDAMPCVAADPLHFASDANLTKHTRACKPWPGKHGVKTWGKTQVIRNKRLSNRTARRARGNETDMRTCQWPNWKNMQMQKNSLTQFGPFFILGVSQNRRPPNGWCRFGFPLNTKRRSSILNISLLRCLLPLSLWGRGQLEDHKRRLKPARPYNLFLCHLLPTP